MKKLLFISISTMAFLVMITSLVGLEKLSLMYYVLVNDFNLDEPSISNINSIPDEIEVSLDERVWLHAVNDSIKLQRALDHFSGFESDIFFDTKKNKFELRHWPDQGETNIFLEKHLSKVKNSSKTPHIWLDFKNLKFLDTNEIQKAIISLEKLINQIGIEKELIIIESQSAKSLDKFKKNGFNCSLWVPKLKPNLLSKRDLELWSENILRDLIDYDLRLISLDVSMHSYALIFLPNVQKMFWGGNAQTVSYLIDE